MNKVVFFGDSNSYISTILFKEFIKNINDIKNIKLVAVVNTTKYEKQNILKHIFVYIVKKIFNPNDKNIYISLQKNFLNYIPKNVHVYNELDINNEDFISKIRELEPDYAFVMGCPQIFKKKLLKAFSSVVNYHNSYLPTYRGLEATSWAMTNNEKYTGYTFHYINEKIDDGNIIFQEKIEIDYSKSSYQNELIKTFRASLNLKKVIKLVIDNFEGSLQVGEKSYYGKKEKEKLLTFYEQKDIDRMRRLINIWGGVWLKINNSTILVTNITQNGKIKRIKWLPVNLYKIISKNNFKFKSYGD